MWPLISNQWSNRIDPFTELNRLQRQMNRLFDTSLHRATDYPAVNISGNESEIRVVAEIPGMDPDKLELTVNGNVLTIEGERTAEAVDENSAIYRQERGTGRFARAIRLPYEADNEKITARYQHGILTVTLPRSEATQPRKIAIKS